MERIKLILVVILFSLMPVKSIGQSQEGNYNVISVNISNGFTKKKELIIQDFMDVEYIPLETKGGFYNQGYVRAMGKDIILLTNRVVDGDIFVYDRNGKALRKFNHKGRGPGEYMNISDIAIDEDKGEIFVNARSQILVYDLHGSFKRGFKCSYTNIFNYDRDNLICYDNDFRSVIADGSRNEMAFVLVSKQDGSITKKIEIPFMEKKSIVHISSDGNNAVTPKGPFRNIIPFKGNWLLSEMASSDTVYTFLPDYSLRPFLVRTPRIQSMNPEVFLTLRLCSDRYIFMEAIRNVYDWNKGEGFSRTYLMYDRQEKASFGYTIYNGDYSIKKEMYMTVTTPVNHEIESWYPLEAIELVESYKNGELKGKLKEIAATLNEEDNPVIMLIKHKK